MLLESGLYGHDNRSIITQPFDFLDFGGGALIFKNAHFAVSSVVKFM